MLWLSLYCAHVACYWNWTPRGKAGLPTGQSGQLPRGPRLLGDPKAQYSLIAHLLALGQILHYYLFLSTRERDACANIYMVYINILYVYIFVQPSYHKPSVNRCTQLFFSGLFWPWLEVMLLYTYSGLRYGDWWTLLIVKNIKTIKTLLVFTVTVKAEIHDSFR